MSAQILNAVWDMAVQEVRYTVHNTGAHERGLQSENHLTAYLCCANGLSVQVNMRTDGEYINGELSMQPKTYQQSSSEITSIRIPSAAHFTPRDVSDLIRLHRLDEYTFTNGGIGCRFYGIVLASIFTDKGWLPAWTAPDLLLKLPFKRSTRSGPVLWRIRLGTFEHRPTQRLAIQLWSRARQALPERIDTVRWALGMLQRVQSAQSMLQRMQSAQSSGVQGAAGAITTARNQLTTALNQLVAQGCWDGTLSVQAAIEEFNFLLGNVRQIEIDHSLSRDEGISLARQRQTEADQESSSDSN